MTKAFNRHLFLTTAFFILSVIIIFLLEGCGRNTIENLQFDEGAADEVYDFIYSSANDLYLDSLREEYNLNAITKGCENDYQRIKSVCDWIHAFSVDKIGDTLEDDDPISILKKLEQGYSINSLESAIVVRGCLNSLGFPTRILSLIKRRGGKAEYIVIEAFLRDYSKWIFIDCQRNAIPFLGRAPLNAIEFQRSIALHKISLHIDGISESEAQKYIQLIGSYLYYFSISLDNRIGAIDPERLILIPLGADEPVNYLDNKHVENTIYTHSVRAFYAKPKMKSP